LEITILIKSQIKCRKLQHTGIDYAKIAGVVFTHAPNDKDTILKEDGVRFT
jgi:hypothetical protein